MVKEKEDESIKKVREISLDSLQKQKDSAENVVKGYKKLKEQFGFDLFPFVLQANKNLVEVLKLQIEMLKEGKRK